MQLIGLILLIASTWYIFKLASNFLDDKTKRELSENSQIIQKQIDELKKRFSKESLKALWKKYKEEDKN